LAKTAVSIFGVPRIQAAFSAEGGALATDGQGTLITTRSCLLNSNRNPVRGGKDRQRMIETKSHKFGIRTVIWLEGDACEHGTSGHVDGYVLLAPSGVVLVDACDDKAVEAPMWRAHDIALLKNAKDANGRRLKIVPVRAPRPRYWNGDPESFSASYLNAYVTNGAVIGARFGDPNRDEAARKALAGAFPGREIVMLRIDHIADGGGGIHCLTQPRPKAIQI
jgi:agmatine deiminase